MEISWFKKFIFVFVNVLFSSFVFSQTTEELGFCIKNIDVDFQTSNWEKVISGGKLFEQNFNKKKYKKKDYSAIIESLNVYYKMAIAYCWEHKTDSSNIVIAKFMTKQAVFPLQQAYADFYKISAQASVAFINNQNDKSEQLFIEAFRIANSKLKSDLDVYTLATENLAVQYISEYRLNEAVGLLYKSLVYFNQSKAPPYYQAQLYYLLYLASYFDANYQAAGENAHKCYFLLQQSENKRECFLAAKAKLAIGTSLYHLKEYNVCKETLHQAWQLFNKFDYLTNQEFALNLNYLAKVYHHLNNNTLALEYKLKVQGIFERMYHSKTHYRLCQIALSSFYTIKGLSVDGIDSEGYDLLTNFEYVFQHMPEDYVHANSARLYIYSMQAFSYAHNKKFLTSVSCLKNGVLLRKSKFPEYHTLLRPWYKMIASCYSEAGKQDSAIFFYEKVIESYKYRNEQHQQTNRTGNKYSKSPELINLFYSIGHCYFQKAKQEKNNKNYFEKALVYFKNCDKLSEQISMTLNNREDKLDLASSMNKVYNQAIACCFNLSALTEDEQEKGDFNKQAFIFSQRSKANRLREMVTKLDIRKKMGLPDQIIKHEHDINNKTSYWEKVISQRTILNTSGFEHPMIYYRRMINDKLFNNSDAIDSLNKYVIQHNKLTDRLKTKFPNYYNLVYEQKVYSIEEIQTHLDTSSVLIDYHQGELYLEIFVVAKNDFSAFRIKTPENFKGIIYDYNYSISGSYKKNDFINKALDVFIDNGTTLYKFLIEPIEKNIKNKKKLIIIASEELSLMPFETLVSGVSKGEETNLAQLDYLIKKYSIVYNYSSNLWVESLIKSNLKKSNPNNFLGIAPVFDPEKMSVQVNLKDSKNNRRMKVNEDVQLNFLPATKKAVDEVCLLAESKNIEWAKYLYKQANKEQFLNNVTDKKYILIATHGKVDYNNPKLSGLYFANTDSTKKDGAGVLFSSEMYNLQLSSDLLVLFACETGTGPISRGEGVMTMSRGFIASGTANVVHTLWSIQDISTRELVVDMFGSVFNNKSYPESLRQAKLKMIDYGIVPFHWAGLVIIGN